MNPSISLFVNSLLMLIGKSYILYYWLPAISVYSFLLFLTISFFIKTGGGQPLTNVKNNVLYKSYFFGLILSLTIFLFRWPSLAYMQLDTDESLEIAGAMTLLSDPVFWRSLDGTSVGPIAYYVLLLPKLFGLTIDYGSAKLVGLGLIIGSVLFLYGTIKNLFKDAIARVAVLPVATFISLLSYWDYISYNGEHVTVFLLCSGLYVCSMLVIITPQKLSRLSFILGLILGSIPFAKLQGIPIALVIAFVGYLIICLRVRDNRAAMIISISYLTIGGLTITVLVFCLLLHFGIFHHFWNSYILDNLYYATQRAFYECTITTKVSFFDKLYGFPFFVLRIEESIGFFVGSITAFVSGVIFLIVYRKKISIFNIYIIASAFLITLASIHSVIQTGNDFAHYLYFLFFPLALLEGVLLGTFCSIFTQKIQRLIAVIFLSVLLALLIPQFYYQSYHERHALFYSQKHNVIKSDVANTILSYASPGEKMIVWGYMPIYYVQTGLIQGTRDAMTIRIIQDNPLQPYFLERFIADMKSSRAPVFVDAVPAFLFDRKTQGHEAFPEVFSLVSKSYSKVAELKGVRIYISKERLTNRKKKVSYIIN